MRTTIRSILMISSAIGLMSGPALAAGKAQAGSIRVTVEGVSKGAPIPETQALCVPTPNGKSDKVAQPQRPTIRWSGVPAGAASVAVFMMDPDVPADFTDAGKDGKLLPQDMKRMDFFHYGLVNLPATTTELPGGSAATPPAQGRELLNDLGLNGYVNPKTAYGGPCPPWNDQRLHHYHFMVLALDQQATELAIALADAPVPPVCHNSSCRTDTAKAVFDRLMESKHVLAEGVTVGTYTLNTALRGK